MIDYLEFNSYHVFYLFSSVALHYTIHLRKKNHKKLKNGLTNKKDCYIIYFVIKLINICALVAKSVDAQDLKSCGNFFRAGSSPARGTICNYILDNPSEN